jgi:hypothetical protein
MTRSTQRRLALTMARWRAGWRDLVGHRDVRGYRDLPAWRRSRLDQRAAWRAARTRGFWRALFLLAALATLARIAAWEFDLEGWRREALAVAPALVVAPWMARGRRRHLRVLLARQRGQ